MVAMPAHITAKSSLSVMRATYGRMSSGASVIPRKMSPTVESASAPEMCIDRDSPRASSATTRCITPRW